MFCFLDRLNAVLVAPGRFARAHISLLVCRSIHVVSYVVAMELCGDRGGAVDLSLEQAIRHKYCPLVEDNAIDPLNHRTITQTALKYKPGI